MSEKNLLSVFDKLATEILFEIFDYLSSNDIIYTFFNLNKRFNSILLQHRRFLNNLSTPTNNFSFWQKILPIIGPQIESLILTTNEFCFSFGLFVNLKSLIICSSLPIYDDELDLILKNEQFKRLNSFKIKSAIVNRNNDYSRLYFDEILHNENSLYIFECFPQLQLSSFENLNINMNLESLSLKVVDFDCLISLLNSTPNLKYLNVLLIIFFPFNQSNLNIDLSGIKLKKFSIVIENGGIREKNFLFLTRFIKQFSSSLIYLSLNLNKASTERFQFDGFAFQQQLLQSMIQLKSFHLYMKLNKQLINIENLLSTFQNQFWFDHNWTFGTDGIYLFTLPFHFDQFNDFINFDEIKSNNSMILNSSNMWSHVKLINFSDSSKFNLNLIKQLKLKMPNLTSITCNIQLIKNLFTNDDQIKQRDIRLDNITTVRCEGENLQTIKQWLIKIFPNTKHLILSDDCYCITRSSNRIMFSQKLDEYFHETDYVDFPKIQYVTINFQYRDLDHMYEHVIGLVNELLQIFKNLQSFIFDFYLILEFPRRCPITDLNKIIQLLNMEKIIYEKYQIKHIHNYLQFLRKNNQ